MPLVGFEQVVGAVVFQAGRDADEVIVAGHVLLDDRLLLARQAETDGPVLRQFPVQRDLLQQRLLVVGLQALIDRIQVDLQRLVARQEVRLEELRADIVARLGDRIAAQLRPGRQVQLLGIAEQVAVMPGGGEIHPEVGRIRHRRIHRMQRPLRQVEIDRQLPFRVQRVGRHGANDREHPDGRQVRARLFNGVAGCTVRPGAAAAAAARTTRSCPSSR